MLVKLAAMDDWEPPGPWSADIILPLKCYPALQQRLCVCVGVGWGGLSPVLFVLVRMQLLDGVAIRHKVDRKEKEKNRQGAKKEVVI